jgi:hypothetical protein
MRRATHTQLWIHMQIYRKHTNRHRARESLRPYKGDAYEKM